MVLYPWTGRRVLTQGDGGSGILKMDFQRDVGMRLLGAYWIMVESFYGSRGAADQDICPYGKHRLRILLQRKRPSGCI